MNDKLHKHSGKAMMETDGDSLTATIDCVTCGRIMVGPIPRSHVASVGAILQTMAEELGYAIRSDGQDRSTG